MTWQRSGNPTVPFSLQQACFRRDGWTCQSCGYVGSRRRVGDLNADHVRNLAQGGATVLGNLMTLCVGCHNLKTLREQRRGRRLPRRRVPPRHPADV